MKKKNKIISKNFKELILNDWYLQRFDAAPFFILLISQAELAKENRKFVGGESTNHVVWFSDRVTDWLIDRSDIARVSELFFRKSFTLKKLTNKEKIYKLNDMKKKNQLIKINFPGLTKTEWYYQHADGVPFFWSTISAPHMIREKRKRNWDFKHLLLFFQDESGDWYIDQSEINRVTQGIIQKSKNESSISQKLIKAWSKDENNFFKKSKKLDKIKFANLSNQELKKLFVNYVDVYLKSVTSSSIIDGFALGTDELIQREIAAFLKDRGMENKQFNYFTVLTAPVTQSFINEAEISLLRVAGMIVKNSSFKKMLIESVETAIKNISDFKKINRALSSHTKNYYWIKNNYYSAYVLNEKDFLVEIRAIILGAELEFGIDFNKEIKRIKSTPLKSKKEKNKIIKQIDLPKHIRNLLTISEDFTYWQDQRKKKTFWMDHYGTLFLKEIGLRYGFSELELKYFIYPEIVELLEGKNKVISHEEASERQKACLFYQLRDNYEILSGKEAKQYKDKIFNKREETNVNDFRGMPASRGRIRGKAKIALSVKDLNKLEKGDILVTVMTRPDYISGIKKAGAIVTDEGGVTCHAAIISRELGIPCIIGTKIGTKVLKDGDEIEVNANHGVVTVINRV